jgi:hypothetical protein
MTVEELAIVISTNQKQFSAEMEKMGKSVSDIGKSAQSVAPKIALITVALQQVINIASKVVNVIGKVVRSFVGLIKGVAEAGMEYTRMQIVTATLAKNLGITREEIDGLRDSLAKANTWGTVAEDVIRTLAMSGLVKMANGLETVDARTGKVEKGVGALVLVMKDLSAAAGIDSAEGIARLTKFIRTGTMSFADGIIEVAKITKYYDDYKRQIGKVGQPLSQLEESMVLMNIVMEEGKKTWGAYANSMQTAGKAVDSTKNAMAAIRAMLGSYLEPVWGAFANALYQIVAGIRQFVFDNADAIRAYATKVAGYIIALIRILGAVMSRLPLIGKYFEWMKTFKLKPISDTAGAIGQIGQSANESADGVSKLKRELLGLAGFDEMNVLTAPESGGSSGASDVAASVLGGISGMGGDIAAEFNNAVEGANSFTDGLEKRITEIGRDLNNTFSDIKAGYDMFVAPPLEAFKLALDDLSRSLGINTEGTNWFTTAILALEFAIGMVVVALTGLVIAINIVIQWFRFLFLPIDMIIGYFKDGMPGAIEAFKRWFNGLPGWMQDIIMAVGKHVLGLIHKFAEVKDRVVGIVSGIVEDIRNRFASIGNLFATFGGELVIKIKVPINSVIDRINSFLSSIRGIKIPGIAPDGIKVPYIPKLATGGIISAPTIAQVGEAGKEAVLPLENNTQWMDDLAGKLGGNMNLTVKIGDDTIFEKAIDYIKDKSMRTGSNILNL